MKLPKTISISVEVRRLVKVMILTGCLALSGITAAPAFANEQIVGLRIGDHGTKTRIVIDLDAPTEFHLTPDGEGLILEIMLPRARRNPDARLAQMGIGLVARYSLSDRATGGTVIRLRLKKPSAVKQVITMRPRDGKGDRLVIDLVTQETEPRQDAVAIEPPSTAQPTPVPTESPASAPQLAGRELEEKLAAELELARAEERATARSQQVQSQRLADLISGAEQGDPVAQYWLANRYLKGNGLPKDLTRAAQEFLRAAKAGYPPAQVQMGLLYRSGIGVEENATESMDWFFRASLSGNRVAQFNLGQIYRLGQGVPKDVSKAAEWYHMSAMRQYPLAQFALGLMHLEGMGRPRDPDHARMWIKAAADQGLAEAKVVLKNLPKR